MWKAIPAVLVVLVWQAASIALLAFGITQLNSAGPYNCDPDVQECVVFSGSGTPEEVAAEQTDDARADAWLVILLGGAASLFLPLMAIIGIVQAPRERLERLKRIKQRRTNAGITLPENSPPLRRCFSDLLTCAGVGVRLASWVVGI